MIYGVTLGSGELADMALCQLESIHKFADISEESIIANCPPSEWDRIDEAKREELRSLSTVTLKPLPVEDYPQSAFQATGLACAEKVGSDDWFILLDTDTLVLDDLERDFDPKYALAAKPSDFHYERVGLSENMVRNAFEIANTSFPDYTCLSTVDKKPIPPYWNAGVVFVHDIEIVHWWIDLIKTLADEVSEGFFIDQLALSILSDDYNTLALTEKTNFPLSQRLWTPSSTKVIHYHKPVELRWVINPLIYRKIQQVKINERLGFGSFKCQIKRFGIRFARLRLRK